MKESEEKLANNLRPEYQIYDDYYFTDYSNFKYTSELIHH